MTSVEVVAAAVVRDGRVLAARRTRPARHAGRWEFPGGKVEPGEDAPAALVREGREELGVTLAVHEALGAAGDGTVHLVLFRATLSSGEPAPGDDHDRLRWLAAADLDSVPWLPIDAQLLPAVAAVLRADAGQGTV